MTNVEQSKWGTAKASFYNSDTGVDPNGHYTDIPITELTMYGQDGCSRLTEGRVTIIALSDGHGHLRGGVEYAKYALRLLPSKVMDELDLIKTLWKVRDYECIKLLMKEIFTDMDSHLRETCPYTNKYQSGGATMTINLKFPHIKQPWKMVSITSNIGDSPFVVVDPSRRVVREQTMEWNCDSLEAWKLYAEECIEAGVVPKSAYLNRFNCSPGSRQIDWVAEKVNGRNQPIEIFKYRMGDGELIVEHNTDTMMKFYAMAPETFRISMKFGGSQSNRGRDKNLEAQQQGLFPSDNYGNTLEGLVQCLSSFGDIDTRTKQSVHSIASEKPDLSILPVHTHIETIHKSRVEVMGSDGLFDVMKDQDLLESVSKHGFSPSSSAQDYLTEIIDSMNRLSYDIKIAHQPPMILFTRFNGKIAWDDVSCWTQVTRVVQPKKKKQKSRGGRKFQKRRR